MVTRCLCGSVSPVVILLGGVLAKLGAYGILRFGLGLFPDAWAALAPVLATWATISVIYGAMIAIAQKDIKRMVAYSSIGHMGYILLGGASLNALSLVGAVAQMVAHGLILAILFHLVGVVEAKVGTRELDVLNGAHESRSRFAISKCPFGPEWDGECWYPRPSRICGGIPCLSRQLPSLPDPDAFLCGRQWLNRRLFCDFAESNLFRTVG